MTTAAQREGQFLICQGLVRDHDFVRYAATLLTPAAARAGLFALYAFNVEIARVRDQITQAAAGEIRMQWWADAVAGAIEGEAGGSPVAAALIDAADRYGLPREQLAELIEARRFDLYDDPMPGVPDLEAYLSRSAGALFDLSARIVAPQQALADGLVHHAGQAQGLVAILMALPLTASRGQCYLPADLLVRHGVSKEAIAAGVPGRSEVIGELAGKAGEHLRQALVLLPRIPPRQRAAFLPLAVTHYDLLRLAKCGNDPFRLSPPSRLRVLWTMWRASRSAAFAG